MEVFECIKTRRSIRKFLDVDIGMDKVGLLVEAGKAAPCAGNLQNWKFVIVKNNNNRHKLADAAFQQYWIASAPVIIVVCAEIEKIEQYYGIRGEKLYAIQNCAAAVQNILLMAHNLGLGACWVSAFDENMVSRVLELPSDARPQAIIPVGYPDEQVPEPMEYTVENVTFLEKWGPLHRIKDFPLFIHDHNVIGRAKESIEEKIEKAKGKYSSKVSEKTKKIFEKVKSKLKSSTKR